MVRIGLDLCVNWAYFREVKRKLQNLKIKKKNDFKNIYLIKELNLIEF